MIAGKQLLTFLGILLFVPLVLAHRAPEGFTTIEQNPNTETIEITHRFHIHDAEHALQEILADPDLSFESLEGKAQLALHVESSFQMVDSKTDHPIELNLIGAQIEGDQILVFQEYTGEFPRTIKMRNDALRDGIPQQVNTVNILLDSQTITKIFNGVPKWKEIAQ